MKSLPSPLVFLDQVSVLSPFELQDKIVLQNDSFSNDLDFKVFFEDYHIGDVHLFYDFYQKTLQWRDFAPMRFAPYLSTAFRKENPDQQLPNPFGIGTITHLLALREVYARNKEIIEGYVASSTPISEGRIVQLQKMGLTPKKTAFPFYFQQSIDYAQTKGFLYAGKRF